jgi:radical SAM-linked protein
MGLPLKIVFSKTGDMRFVSHLDLMRLFQRAVRRAEMPVTLTKGFSPHLKISITRALKLGVESSGEEAVFHMDQDMWPQDFADAMNAKLPEGVRIVSAENI